MSYELQEYTYQKCEERGLEYELVLAVMWRESRFDADAVNVNVNGTQDNGIMQINDVNKAWLNERWGIEDLMDPYQNIDAGTAMLGGLTDKYGAHRAMLAYQYGEAGMARKLANGVTTSTAIEKAYRQREVYKELLETAA
jgi:soluble lytic murein transglycosylase-like protein